MEITLTRQKKISNLKSQILNRAIHGTLTLPFDPNSPLTYDTLENADFLIPEGIYPLKNTWSPKFKKFMPEICDVPDRAGIRIHMGTKPEHSKGCVLVSFEALANIRIFIDRININYQDELQIKITSEPTELESGLDGGTD